MQEDNALFKQESSLSELSRSRIKDTLPIPQTLVNANYRINAIKRYTPFS